MRFANNTLATKVYGSYNDSLPIANITIMGLSKNASSLHISLGESDVDSSTASWSFDNGTLRITDLETASQAGIWSGNFSLALSTS